MGLKRGVLRGPRLRLAVADACALSRWGIHRLCRAKPGVEVVVHGAPTSAALMAAVYTGRADCLLIDPGPASAPDFISLYRQLRQCHPQLRVLIYSGEADVLALYARLSPWPVLDKRSSLSWLHRALHTFPDADAFCVSPPCRIEWMTLRLWLSGMSQTEVARHLAVSKGAVSMRLLRLVHLARPEVRAVHRQQVWALLRGVEAMLSLSVPAPTCPYRPGGRWSA